MTGTPLGVDVSADRRARVVWAAFLSGPVIWFTHFMLVYLVAEAACTGEGRGLEIFDPPVSHVLTLVATALAAAASAGCAVWGYRRWRADDRAPRADGSTQLSRGLDAHVRSMAFAGFLLATLSCVAVVSVGLPALFLPGC